MIRFLAPNPSISLYFQTDKLIFGCVYAKFGPPVTSTYNSSPLYWQKGQGQIDTD